MREASLTVGAPSRYNIGFRVWSRTWTTLLALLALAAPIKLASKPVLVFLFEAGGEFRVDDQTTQEHEPVTSTDPSELPARRGQTSMSRVTMIFAGGLIYYSALFAFLIICRPMFFRNGAIANWYAEARAAKEAENIPSFVIEMNLFPRGLRPIAQLLADVDDVGLLSFYPDGLRIEGDSFTLDLPAARISRVSKEIGSRYSWLGGPEYRIYFHEPIERRTSVWIRVREGATVLTVRRRALELREQLKKIVPADVIVN